MTPLYTTEATTTGGRDGRGWLAEGGLGLSFAFPKEIGGSGHGSNPEQLFALGYAACFGQAILVVGGKHKIDTAKATVTVKVTLNKTEAGGFALSAELAVKLPGVDKALAETIVAEAHEICPYSNATRNNVPVTLTVL